MAKRFPFVVPYKELAKHFQSTTLKAATINNNKLISFTIANHAHMHTQGGDPLAGAANQGATEVMESVEETAKEAVDTAWDAAKNTAQLVTDTSMAEADTNVVDTVEYRSSEDLRGQLGDGCDN